MNRFKRAEEIVTTCYVTITFFMTQENVSHCGSTTTVKPIVGLFC